MISHIDHLVLTTRELDKCVDFYTEILGMELQSFSDGRKALTFGNQKINIHEYGHEIEPKAHLPVPGSLDICLISDKSISEVKDILQKHSVDIEIGPVKRTGAQGDIESVYVRDLDLNLIEISNYLL